MKIFLTLFFISLGLAGQSQNQKYSTGNAHSHNDYEQQQPFWKAYSEGFGSIEADIFLLDSNLYVAHDAIELLKKKSLIDYYLEPIESCINKNKGFVYSDTSKHLQVLIDIKTGAINTLTALIQLLQKYPSLINNKTISWVISGNRPDENLFTNYPSFIYFDGDVSKDYSPQALSKIKMMSASFGRYSSWQGENNMPGNALSSIKNAVDKVHLLNKSIRFWASPDNPNAWMQFMDLGIDYINTDKIDGLADFMKKVKAK